MLKNLLISIFLVVSTTMAVAGSEALTTIILINSEAFLVDIDSDGEVLKKHIEVPHYFRSGQSHQALVQQAMRKSRPVYGMKSYKLFDNSHFLAAQYVTQTEEVLLAKDYLSENNPSSNQYSGKYQLFGANTVTKDNYYDKGIVGINSADQDLITSNDHQSVVQGLQHIPDEYPKNHGPPLV